jgi:hypothetical protein
VKMVSGYPWKPLQIKETVTNRYLVASLYSFNKLRLYIDINRGRKEKITPTYNYGRGGYRIPLRVYPCFIEKIRGCRLFLRSLTAPVGLNI